MLRKNPMITDWKDTVNFKRAIQVGKESWKKKKNVNYVWFLQIFEQM